MTPGNRMMTEKSYLQNLVHSQFFPELGKKKEPKRYTFDLDLTRHRNPLKKKRQWCSARAVLLLHDNFIFKIEILVLFRGSYPER